MEAPDGMDEIRIEGMRVLGRHGAYPGEKDEPQPFDVSLRLFVDLDAASRSDALSDTLDYAEIHRRVVDVIERTSFDLIERLGAEILRAVFEDDRVQGAEVTIGKPGRLAGATASVTLRRARSGRSG
jgi:dihydroneopterin aldolase